MSGCGTRIVLRGQKPLALCDRCPCFGSLFPPLAALTFAASSIICAFGLAAAAPRLPYRHLELCGVAQSLWCGCSSLLHWVTKCDVLFKLHLQQALHTTAGGWPHFREEVRTMRFTFTFHVGRKTITLGLVVKSKNRHPGRRRFFNELENLKGSTAITCPAGLSISMATAHSACGKRWGSCLFLLGTRG